MGVPQVVKPDPAHLCIVHNPGERLVDRVRVHDVAEVRRWLETRPEVNRVLHPALETCPGHDLFARDFRLERRPDFTADALLYRIDVSV